MAPTTDSTTTITLISGANGGLGLATAQRLAREHGHHVIIGSRNPEAGEQAAAALRAEGHLASSVALDLDSQATIDAAAAHIRERFGRLDVLVNNAGILLDQPLEDGRQRFADTRDLFERTLRTNVVGTACLTDAVAPLLRARREKEGDGAPPPRVVFVSSSMGSATLSADPSVPWYSIDYTAYDASKAAVQVLALNWARRLADVGARVNVVCPGLVATNLGPGVKGGVTPYVGAQRPVELATLGPDGPTATFSSAQGPVPW